MRARVMPIQKWLGSLPMAVTLILVIALILAVGTLYELKFGTAAVQATI